MEIFLYSFIFIIALFLIPLNINKKEIATFLIIFIYPIVIRFSGFDYDMEIYADFVEYKYIDLTEIYYLKEIGFWGSLYILGTIFPPKIAFIILDYLILFLIYRIFKNIQINEAYILIILIFFPAILGFQNIYRNFLAITLILYAISITNKSFLKSLFITFFAISVHNTSILFSPLILFTNKRNSRIYKITAIIATASLFYLLNVFFENFTEYSDSQLSSGFDFSLIYSLLTFILFMLILIISNFYKSKQFGIISISLYISCLSISSTVLPSSISERISLMCLYILMPFLLKIIFDMQWKHKSSLIFFLILMIGIPIFITPSIFSFIV